MGIQDPRHRGPTAAWRNKVVGSKDSSGSGGWTPHVLPSLGRVATRNSSRDGARKYLKTPVSSGNLDDSALVKEMSPARARKTQPAIVPPYGGTREVRKKRSHTISSKLDRFQTSRPSTK